jgi:hypothetical protein
VVSQGERYGADYVIAACDYKQTLLVDHERHHAHRESADWLGLGAQVGGILFATRAGQRCARIIG